MNKVLLLASDNSKSPSFGYKCKSALQRLGYEVNTFNYRFMHLHRMNFTKKLLNRSILSMAEKLNPDLLLVLKGESILPGTISKISATGTKTAVWSLDEPFGKYSSFNKISNMREYDAFFTFDPFYVKKLKSAGVKHAFYLPCAADPKLHTEQIPQTKRDYKYDISFIGTHDSKRENLLWELKDYNLRIYGYNWFHANKLKDRISRQRIDATKSVKGLKSMCGIFNVSKINMNIHHIHSVNGLNLRTFEIPATKSFQLCDYYSELPKLFKKNKEIVTYNDVTELKQQVDYYLDSPEERLEISLKGYHRVVKDHTFDARIKTLLSHL